MCCCIHRNISTYYNQQRLFEVMQQSKRFSRSFCEIHDKTWIKPRKYVGGFVNIKT